MQTQVLPYLREIVKGGIAVDLLTFESETLGRGEELELAAELEKDGIIWRSLRYHKRPAIPATLWDVLAGAIRIIKSRPDVVHARGHVPMAMAIIGSKIAGVRIIFDIRGLLADEYVDAGNLRAGGAGYRVLKWVERTGMRSADGIVVLTERMRDWVKAHGAEAAIEVIPCCVDLSKFPERYGRSGGNDLVYAGSVTGLYLLEEMGRFFVAWKRLRPDAVFRILTGAPADQVRSVLAPLGIGAGDLVMERVSPDDVPGRLARASAGLSFRKATFSQIAASPTKIPEYLAAGLPVVSNRGIGDTDKIIEKGRVGVIIDDLSAGSIERAAEELAGLISDPGLPERCRRLALDHFDLATVGGKRYRDLYSRVLPA
ncbi:MAG: glycosyltransferase [Blastocatellales bacterium]